ncbi:MAG TPA: hypothetical protein VKB30_02610 [Candidatus Limnocylindrales bacterium]|nr:hypothetical protein [Candidatus Limnocylindrales bacterium]
MTPGSAAARPQPGAGGARTSGSTAHGVRLRWGATISGAVLVTLVRPASWAFGLLGFLAGGGLVLVAWPILVLPTPTGLQNALGNPISSLVFGAPSATLLTILLGGLVAGLTLLGAALLAGAWAEREGIAITLDAAADEGIVAPAPALDGAPGPGRIAVIRLLALAPVAVALLLAWRPVYDVTYRELILPESLATPLPIRVLGEVPWVVIGIAIAWQLGDAAASVGVRRLVIERRPVLVAWLLGWADLVRRPHRVVPTALAGIGVVVLLTVPGLLAAGVGWSRVRQVVLEGGDTTTIAVALLTWVATWLGVLALAGVGSAFRSAAWTLELPRRRSVDA